MNNFTNKTGTCKIGTFVSVNIILLATISASAQKTQPLTTRSANEKKTSPTKIACNFIKQMETILSLEHQAPKKAQQIKSKLIPLMSTQNISIILKRFHRKIEDIPKEKIINVQTAYLDSWLASINFYTGHIQYKHAKLIRTATTPDKLIFADIVIPVDRVKQTTPINIFVRCIKQQDIPKSSWQIHMIRLFPRISKTKSKKSTTKKQTQNALKKTEKK